MADVTARNDRILYIALGTYGRMGGLQNFNRRQIANLATLLGSGALSEVRVHLTDDLPSELPGEPLGLVAFGRDRLRFLLQTLNRARRSDHLLIGHINLLPVAWLAKCLNSRLRLTLFVHGDEAWNGVARAKRSYEPWMLRVIDRIAAVSLYTARIMGAEYRVMQDRFTLYPNAVDLIDPASQPAAKPGDVVLAVSRLGIEDRRKNIDQLVRAIALLKLQGRPGRLEVIGDGALRAELEALAVAEGVADRVRFLGRVDDATLGQAYQRASVFALPSSKEGFGIVYLEAWLRGLPVICGKLGAAHEVVSHSVDGLVIDETSSQELAASITLLLSDPGLANEMGNAGGAKVKAKYLNDSACRNLRNLLGLEA